ncbi:hypothetical protein NMG60_11013042 [Bertholletia excelsa]
MAQFGRSGSNCSPGHQAATVRGKLSVKPEVEDCLEEEHGPLNKRSKLSTHSNEWSGGNNEFPIPSSQYNPLDEPSPLGLRLRKSPSLLDLIQMRLAQCASSVDSAQSSNLSLIERKDGNGAPTDKLKASNFPALLLRIGCWEYVSRYEGDLVAKCYFAKHKLVWEILEDGLKSKIEIQWSDIKALKANFPDDGPGTLNVTLARPPLFFREINPQPRKHTLWQATADFTDGQATVHRQHFLQCTQGILNKHYEKLIQCDTRLNLVSRQPEIVLGSPYFEAQSSVFRDLNQCNDQEVDQLETARRSPTSGLQDVSSPSGTQSCSLKSEEQNSVGISSEHLSPEAPSPSSVMDLCAKEGNGSHTGDGFQTERDREQLKVPGLHPSMSMSDLVNHIGHCISEQMAYGNPSISKEALESQSMLENIAQILLSDAQLTTASDEKKLMSRVNSLCCLLQDPPPAQNVQVCSEHCSEGLTDGKDIQRIGSGSSKGILAEYSNGVPGGKQASPMSRKDSFGDLLLNLPRIASLPKFLSDISEDGENQGTQ